LFLGNQEKLLPTELHILTIICTKSFAGWGFAPDRTKGADSAPPDLLAIYRGPTSKEMGENGENRTGVEGRGKESWGDKGRREDGK